MPADQPSRHTILVVDDEPDVVRSVHDLLRLDYRVLSATRAADGMRLLEEEEVHVIMTDQRMPGMTGVAFLAHCRNEYPEAIRLLFTGYADIHAVIDAINQGNVYRYITKPWDPDELLSIIREAVERYGLIVERRRLLVELQKKNTELADAVCKLQESDALKSAFIKVASHELRTPLAILLGITSLARRVQDLPAPMGDWLERIDRSANRLQHLVDQLVTMLSAGKFELPLRLCPTDLASLVAQAADDLRPFVELRRQNLVLDCPGDLGILAVEPPRIRDAINHLLMNAIKFTPDGGTITLAAAREPQRVLIQVRDTGCGIEQGSLPRLFQPFYTQHDVSHHSSGTFEFGRRGLGLGLSVVKEFVEMHGGTVAAESRIGQGSTFTITLPVAGPSLS